VGNVRVERANFHGVLFYHTHTPPQHTPGQPANGHRANLITRATRSPTTTLFFSPLLHTSLPTSRVAQQPAFLLTHPHPIPSTRCIWRPRNNPRYALDPTFHCEMLTCCLATSSCPPFSCSPPNHRLKIFSSTVLYVLAPASH
jgi:hypothetical protein